MAMVITTGAEIAEVAANTYTYNGITFKAYEQPREGDFICRLTMEDTYHVSRAVFMERNIVE